MLAVREAGEDEMWKLSAWLAIAVAAPLSVSQLARNWGNWEHWWTWGVDELVAALLVAAGIVALRGGSQRFLAPAWAFAVALYLTSFLQHQFTVQNSSGDLQAKELQLTMIVAGLLAASLAGLALSLFERRAR